MFYQPLNQPIQSTSTQTASNSKPHYQPTKNKTMSSFRNFYEILNCTPAATFDELRSSYKQLILQSHPDKQPHPKCCPTSSSTSVDGDTVANTTADMMSGNFVAINEAWNTLKDPAKRRLYDAELLLSKFETHSNVYARLTLSDMQQQKHGVNEVDEKEMSPTSDECCAYNYYTYDCRCGGQYIIDESTDMELFKGRRQQQCSNGSDNKCAEKNDKNEEASTHSEGVATTMGATKMNNNENSDNNDEDADVMIECSECSLHSNNNTLAHSNRKTYTAITASNSAYRSTTITTTPPRQSIARKMATTGDIWLQWFSCCFHQPQSPSRRRHQRLRIDRSMISNPTNFVHTGHIGSADVELSTNHLNALQTQMQGKGGYEMNSIRLQAC